MQILSTHTTLFYSFIVPERFLFRISPGSLLGFPHARSVGEDSILSSWFLDLFDTDGQSDSDGGGDGGGRLSPEPPSSMLHAPRHNLSRDGRPLTLICIYIYIYIYITTPLQIL